MGTFYNSCDKEKPNIVFNSLTWILKCLPK